MLFKRSRSIMQKEILTKEQEKILKERVNQIINNNYQGKDLLLKTLI